MPHYVVDIHLQHCDTLYVCAGASSVIQRAAAVDLDEAEDAAPATAQVSTNLTKRSFTFRTR
jgi:uncharacterized metal-binding protein